MIYAAIFSVAFLVGATAIGGLLLVPVVVILGKVPVHTAIPACLFAILFSGIVGSFVFGARGHVGFRDISLIALPAGCAALLGAIMLPLIEPRWIEVLITVLCFVGFYASVRPMRSERASVEPEMSKTQFAGLGAFTGLGSSLSGTGGPLILIPILTVLGFPEKRTIGMAQAIQLPIAGFAAAGNVATGVISYDLAIPIAFGVVLGSLCGAVFAQKVGGSVLRPLVSATLLICGIVYLGRITQKLFGG